MATDKKLTLQALSQGVKPAVNSQDPGTVWAQQASASAGLQQVAPPAQYNTVNMGQINDNSDETYQQTFYNATGALRYIVLGGLFSLVGEYQYFNQVPSAVDFATFQAPAATYPNNGGDIQSLAKRFGLLPAIISAVWLQSNVPSQSTQNMIVGKVTKSLNFMETTKYAPMCDACDNNNTTLYTKEFVGVFPAGKQNYLRIPIIAHSDNTKFTTVRITWTGEAETANLTAANTF